MSGLLFGDFPPVSTEAWEDQIRQDLGDAAHPPLWHLPDGLTIRPYYREEDVAHLERASAKEAVEIPAGWQLRQDIRTPDLDAAAVHARTAVESGVDVLGIDLGVESGRYTGVPIRRVADFKRLLDGFSEQEIALHLRGGAYSPSLLACFLDAYPDGRRATSLQFDPVGASAQRGRRLDGLLDLAADLIQTAAGEELRDLRVLSVASTPFHEAGATPILETALHLASLSETLVQMVERGVRSADVLKRLIIETPVESSYFLEIARLRALRLCIRHLIDAFAPDEWVRLPPIHGETSWRNQTIFDPHENLLRATTEAASAVIGGCDVVCVQPFDSAAGRYDEFSYRMARNVQHLLRYESGFGRVADPAAGSYYVEVLTDAIGRRAWQLFQEIEAEGGLFKALESGFVHRRVETALSEQRRAVAERRRVLIGTNHYPAPEPRDALAPPAPLNSQSTPGDDAAWRTFAELRAHISGGGAIDLPSSLLDGPTLGPPLPRERLAESVERRRFRTERLDTLPRVVIVPFGDPATRSSRADFAANFLGCGGFAIETLPGRDDLVEAGADLRDRAADVVVCCATDADYGGILDEVHRQLSSDNAHRLIGIVAGPQVSDELSGSQFDFSIHRGSNLLDVLDFIQQRLGSSRIPRRRRSDET